MIPINPPLRQDQSAPPIYRPAISRPAAPPVFCPSPVQPKLQNHPAMPAAYKSLNHGGERMIPVNPLLQQAWTAPPVYRPVVSRPMVSAIFHPGAVRPKSQFRSVATVQRRSVIQMLNQREICDEVQYWNFNSVWEAFSKEDVADLALLDPAIAGSIDYDTGIATLRQWLTDMELQRNVVPAPVPLAQAPLLVALPRRASDDGSPAGPVARPRRNKPQKTSSHGYRPLDLTAIAVSGPASASSFASASSPESASFSVPVGADFPSLPVSTVSSSAAASAPTLPLAMFSYAPPPSQVVVPVDIYAGLSAGARNLAQIIWADRQAFLGNAVSARYKSTTMGAAGTLKNYGHGTLYSRAILDEVGGWWNQGHAYEYAGPAPKDYENAHDVANFLFHPGGPSFNWHGLQTGPKS